MSPKLRCLPIARTTILTASNNKHHQHQGRPTSHHPVSNLLTEEDADEREDDELRNDEEREVARDDGAVHARVRVRAHVLRQLAHDDGQCPPEQRRHRRGQHTRNERKRPGRLLGPGLEERHERGELQRTTGPVSSLRQKG